jgi:hypothetical protein
MDTALLELHDELESGIVRFQGQECNQLLWHP